MPPLGEFFFFLGGGIKMGEMETFAVLFLSECNNPGLTSDESNIIKVSSVV